MFSNGDYLTEIIAHFIGHFEVAEEEARMRNAHDAFAYNAPGQPALDDPQAKATPFKAPVVPVGYDPDVSYTPSRVLPDTFLHGQLFRFEPPLIEIPNTLSGAQIDRVAFAALAGESRQGPLIGEAPGSFAFVAQQHRILFDDDTIVIGDPEDQPLPVRTDDPLGHLERLVLEAGHAASGLSAIPVAMTETGAGEFARAATAALSDVANATATGSTLSGMWINGTPYTDEAPDLGDYLPEPWASEVEEDDTASGDPIHINASLEDTTMIVETGNNLSVNQASIVNAGLGGTTLAVAGDVYQLDIVIQTTAWSDMDDFSTWPFS